MIRTIDERDIKEITEVCRKGMEFDRFTEDLVWEKTIAARDFNPQLGLVYEEEGKVVGFAQSAMGKRNNQPHGWIRLLVVNPAYRRQGVGRSLIEESEQRLGSLGVSAVSIMDSVPNYLTPGLDFRYTPGYCFLEKQGYERIGYNIDLICDVLPDKYHVDDAIARLDKEGFIIKRAAKNERGKVMDFIRKDFTSWEAEVSEAFYNEPISLHICIYEKKVVGFSAYDTNNKGTGWFGPMGVTPVTRGKGIGGILCQLCLRDIAMQGHRTSVIPWVGPVYFYSRVCDARLDRIFWVWHKKLNKRSSL